MISLFVQNHMGPHTLCTHVYSSQKQVLFLSNAVRCSQTTSRLVKALMWEDSLTCASTSRHIYLSVCMYACYRGGCCKAASKYLEEFKNYTHVVLNHLIILWDQISLSEWFLYKWLIPFPRSFPNTVRLRQMKYIRRKNIHMTVLTHWPSNLWPPAGSSLRSRLPWPHPNLIPGVSIQPSCWPQAFPAAERLISCL